MMHRILASAVAIMLVTSSCGGGEDFSLPNDTLVIVVSSDLSVGRHRVAIGALGPQNESRVSDAPVSLEFSRSDGSLAGETESEFIWAIEDVRGMWVTEFVFDRAGIWTVGVRTANGDVVTSAPFNVAETSSSVTVGDQAPQSVSRTLETSTYQELTSDPDPDSRFYEQTVAQAVTSGKPSVIVFATPAFCTSATCGPVLEVAKEAVDEFPDVNWVHVEVYTNLDASSFEELQLEPAISEWRLMTEPWVFVVDGGGVVSARFEGAVGAVELRRAVDNVTR